MKWRTGADSERPKNSGGRHVIGCDLSQSGGSNVNENGFGRLVGSSVLAFSSKKPTRNFPDLLTPVDQQSGATKGRRLALEPRVDLCDHIEMLTRPLCESDTERLQ